MKCDNPECTWEYDSLSRLWCPFCGWRTKDYQKVVIVGGEKNNKTKELGK